MSISAFLRELAARDIRVALNGNKLLLSAGAGLLTASTRADIAARKDEIIAFLRSANARVAAPIELRHAPQNEPLCLSFAQQRLWFLHKLEPASPGYNLGAGVDIPASVDESVLRKSLIQLALRHSVLRTVFVETDGVPSQVVTDTLPQLRVADLREMPAETRDEESRRVRDEEVARPFDLAAAPLIRALLIRLTDTHSLFVLTIHHVIADGWSLSLIVKELGELYEAIQSGREPRLPELAIQYADYAYSERRWFEETGEQAHGQYWKEKLSGTLASLDLPTDRPRDRITSSRGGSVQFTFPAELAERLRALGRGSGVTFFTTLLTVFKTMLYRYSGQPDVIVGTAVANRTRVELESLIGMFVSTLVLRSDLSGDPSAQELLRRVHETVLDALEHQDYPFEKLVDLSRTERSLAHTPLFQSAFVLHNTPGRETYQSLGAGSMFELSLYVWDVPGKLPALLEYNADLFDAETIERMAGHLVTLAESVVADPNQPISRLRLLTAPEQTQLLETWNATQTLFDDDACVHTLFERQVSATPDAIALVAPVSEGSDEMVRMTYRELDCRANRIARRLRRLGVGPDARVAIALDRSADLVATLLAVWKAGGAYVPLDPAYPADRLTFMIEDAGIAAMVTRDSVRLGIAPVTCPVVDLDRDADAIRSEPDTPPRHVGGSRDLAYVIYTSGSTGRPKGVLIEHRSVVNFLRSMQREPGLRADDTLLSVTTLSFDIAGLELYLPLITGARIVLVSRAVATDGVRLAET
ncbi:MAG TPA: condensation domain-containing protein, partial [Gemmatimonadaceae bacterium]